MAADSPRGEPPPQSRQLVAEPTRAPGSAARSARAHCSEHRDRRELLGVEVIPEDAGRPPARARAQRRSGSCGASGLDLITPGACHSSRSARCPAACSAPRKFGIRPRAPGNLAAPSRSSTFQIRSRTSCFGSTTRAYELPRDAGRAWVAPDEAMESSRRRARARRARDAGSCLMAPLGSRRRSQRHAASCTGPRERRRTDSRSPS